MSSSEATQDSVSSLGAEAAKALESDGEEPAKERTVERRSLSVSLFPRQQSRHVRMDKDAPDESSVRAVASKASVRGAGGERSDADFFLANMSSSHMAAKLRPSHCKMLALPDNTSEVVA
jgi:hypothetical protein